MYLLTLSKRLYFHSVLQDYTKTTTTNFHKIAGKVAGRDGCVLWGRRGGLSLAGRDMTIWMHTVLIFCRIFFKLAYATTSSSSSKLFMWPK